VTPATLAGTALIGAVLSACLIRLLRPLLVRYALARPNARSSHTIPTPQGGGIAVLAAALTAGAGGLAVADDVAMIALAVPGLAVLTLAILGGLDDIRPLPALPRLVVQITCVAAVVLWVNPARMLPDAVPLAVERGLLILAGTWWVNLVNFMDGIDWITVSEFIPLTGAIVLFGAFGHVSVPVALSAAALLGGLLGFAPANRPVARLFLGDVGSLPIGLLTGWMLIELAGGGALVAALLLPLYYVADATLTLLRRLARRERVWLAHRSHFYQRACDNGFTVMAVDVRVFTLNVALAILAAVTLRWPHPAIEAASLAVALALVGWTLRVFATPRAATGVLDPVAPPGSGH
jgi:UDP-N-acetylmuramyl pentapeptide phosphotransferase/UDP-N-acetylglucosamine-1-phosphate transferase